MYAAGPIALASRRPALAPGPEPAQGINRGPLELRRHASGRKELKQLSWEHKTHKKHYNYNTKGY